LKKTSVSGSKEVLKARFYVQGSGFFVQGLLKQGFVGDDSAMAG